MTHQATAVWIRNSKERSEMSRFDGKVGIITGAASGIGKKIALRFAPRSTRQMGWSWKPGRLPAGEGGGIRTRSAPEMELEFEAGSLSAKRAKSATHDTAAVGSQCDTPAAMFSLRTSQSDISPQIAASRPT
jgi:hypothetical protein